MRQRSIDAGWEVYGKTDPFFGVLNHDRFHAGVLDDAAREEFYESGAEHIAGVIADVRRHLDPHFAPQRALDFGCGVGRLVVALARQCAQATGVDIAPSMLAEARRNCQRYGLENVAFALSDDTLSQVKGKFDLVHSYIVLQHITTSRGEKLLAALLAKIDVDGVGALHLTYARNAPRVRKLVHWMRKRMPLANGVVNVAEGRSFAYPLMAMNDYDVARVLEIVRGSGFSNLHMSFTDHGGHLGVMMYVKREPMERGRGTA